MRITILNLLLIAQLIFNYNVFKTIEVLLFFANIEIDPNLFLELREDSKAKLVVILFRELGKLYQEIKNRIK